MYFKITFTDGSLEIVNANSMFDAKSEATAKFRERIVRTVERAGLGDLGQRPKQRVEPKRTSRFEKTPLHERRGRG